MLNTFCYKLNALELLQSILDEFSEDNYIFSEKAFIIQEKFRVSKVYDILTHQKIVISSEDYKVLFKLELDSSFLYHIETSDEVFDVENLPREQNETVEYISKNLDEEIIIGLN